MKFKPTFKNKENKIKRMRFWKNERFIFSLVGLVSLLFFIFSYLDVKVLTTIHTYVFGALFGFSSIFVYLGIFIICIMKVFDWEGKITFRHFYFSFIRYIVFSLIVIIFAGMIYNVNNYVRVKTAGNNFNIVFNSWFNDFSKTSDAALPNKFTAGILSNFIFAILSSIGTQFLAIIISTILFIIAIIIFFIPTHKFYLLSFSRAKRMSARQVQDKHSNTNMVNDFRPRYQNKKPEIVTTNVNLNADNIFSLEDITSKSNTEEITTNYLDENPFDTTEFEIITTSSKSNINLENEVKSQNEFIQNNTNFLDLNEENNTLEEDENFLISQHDFENYKIQQETKNKKERRFSLVQDEEDLGL